MCDKTEDSSFQDFRDSLQRSSSPITKESSFSDTPQREEYLKSGFDEYVNKPLARFLSQIFSEEEMIGFGDITPNEDFLEFGPNANTADPVLTDDSPLAHCDPSLLLNPSSTPTFYSLSPGDLPNLPDGVDLLNLEVEALSAHLPSTRFLARETFINNETQEFPSHQYFETISATYYIMKTIEEDEMTRDMKSENRDRSTTHKLVLRLIGSAGVGLHFGDPELGHSVESTYGTVRRILRHVEDCPFKFLLLSNPKTETKIKMPTIAFMLMMATSNIPLRHMLLNNDNRWIADPWNDVLFRFHSVVISMLSPLLQCEEWINNHIDGDYIKDLTSLAIDIIVALSRLERVIELYTEMENFDKMTEWVRQHLNTWIYRMETEPNRRRYRQIYNDPKDPLRRYGILLFSTLILRVVLLYITPYAAQSFRSENRQYIHWLVERIKARQTLGILDFQNQEYLNDLMESEYGYD
jgi:hypothetical protein